MKPRFKLYIIGTFALSAIFYSCLFPSSDRKIKLYNKRIDSGKVVKLVFDGGGDFDIIYANSKNNNTLFVGGYASIYNEIDTLTIINKKAKSYWLHLTGLKNEKGERYNDSIELIYRW